MSLHALSPLDGRYENETSVLRDYFSEFSYFRMRVQLEEEYLAALARKGICPPFDGPDRPADPQNFTEQDALQIQAYENTTRHDVKAIEYYLRERLPSGLASWIHFGLTSEDINNIAQSIALRDSRDHILLPTLDRLLDSLAGFALRYRALPMLGRTHGQPAVPTTLGKEIAVYLGRLKKGRDAIAGHRFEAKLNGAVGNFNALHAASPDVDWISFSREFLDSLGLDADLATTQILPYDNWIHYLDHIRLANSVLTGFTQDVWRYISDGYLKQRAIEGEIGSSTMPHKVNPIDFENAEGNLGIANALLVFYSGKLPISRLQRDLSDSTVRRTFGVALGHTLLAWNNILRGLSRVEADEAKIRGELNGHWEVVGEGAQSILRAAGWSEAYETLMALTRGRNMTETEFKAWAAAVEVDEGTRSRLMKLSPESYIGLAVQLTDSVLESGPNSEATPARRPE